MEAGRPNHLEPSDSTITPRSAAFATMFHHGWTTRPDRADLPVVWLLLLPEEPPPEIPRQPRAPAPPPQGCGTRAESRPARLLPAGHWRPVNSRSLTAAARRRPRTRPRCAGGVPPTTTSGGRRIAPAAVASVSVPATVRNSSSNWLMRAAERADVLDRQVAAIEREERRPARRVEPAPWLPSTSSTTSATAQGEIGPCTLLACRIELSFRRPRGAA